MTKLSSRAGWHKLKRKLRLKDGALGPWLILGSVFLVIFVFLGQMVDSVRLASQLNEQRHVLTMQEKAATSRSIQTQLEAGQLAMRRNATVPLWGTAVTTRLGGGELADVNRELDRRRVQEGFAAFFVVDMDGRPWGRSLTAPALHDFSIPSVDGVSDPVLITTTDGIPYVRWLTPILVNQFQRGWLVGVRPASQLLSHLPAAEGWKLEMNYKLKPGEGYALNHQLMLLRTQAPQEGLLNPVLRQAISLSVWSWAGLVAACALLMLLARRENRLLKELEKPRQNRLLMQALLNATGRAPAVVTDGNGRITHMNRRAENLFGYTQKSQWSNQPARVLFGDEGLPDSDVDTAMCRRMDGQIFTAVVETQEVDAGGGFIYWLRDPVETDTRVTSAGHETMVQMINQWLSDNQSGQTALCAAMKITGSRPRRGSSLQRVAVRAMRQKMAKNELVADLGDYGVGVLLTGSAGKERIQRLLALQGEMRRLLRSVDDGVTISVGVVTLPRQAADGHEAIERAAQAAAKAAEAGGSQLLHYDGLI